MGTAGGSWVQSEPRRHTPVAGAGQVRRLPRRRAASTDPARPSHDGGANDPSRSPERHPRNAGAHARRRPHSMTETLAPVKPGKLIINGEAVDAASGKTFTTHEPRHRGADHARSPRPAPRTWTARCKAARAAFEGPWAKMKPAERQRAAVEARRPGARRTPTSSRASRRSTTASRSSSRARSTSPWSANCFHYFSGWATKLTGETLPVNPGVLHLHAARAASAWWARSSRGTSR